MLNLAFRTTVALVMDKNLASSYKQINKKKKKNININISIRKKKLAGSSISFLNFRTQSAFSCLIA